MSPYKEIIDNLLDGSIVTAILRIIMGLLFLYSGYFKMIDPQVFAPVISNYGILPELLIPYTAIILPVLELILGALLIIGYKVKASSFLSLILMIIFITAVTVNLIKGNNFNCGCFELGRFGISENISIGLIVRDLIFAAILALLLITKNSPFSIDSRKK